MAQPSSSTRYCARCLSTFEDDVEQCPNLSCRRARPTVGWGRMFGPGDLFDRHYRIHSLLALGGAGVTYLAREVGGDGEEIGTRLALKVLFASRDEGPYLRRLATEAQVIQELDHPNIVQYLGFVHRAGHSPYLVTRFEPGGSLLDHIKRTGSLSVRRTAQICRQVCWALDKAHSMGVVHRDLKPENVLLARVVGPDEDPVVRVADFGIAKVQGALGGVTRVGAFVGTPQYAAPEQFVGGTPTPATDVYGVGTLAYFCTMVLPVVRFADRLDPEEGYHLLVGALPPTVVRAHDDGDDVRRLNRILEVCMDPDPTRRCSAEQLDGLLGALVAGHEPDCDGVHNPERVASPTLTADPDTHERMLAALSGDGAPLLVAPPARSPAAGQEGEGGVGALGLLAGVAAGAAMGAAANWLAHHEDEDIEPAAASKATAAGASQERLTGTEPAAVETTAPGAAAETPPAEAAAETPAPAAAPAPATPAAASTAPTASEVGVSPPVAPSSPAPSSPAPSSPAPSSPAARGSGLGRLVGMALGLGLLASVAGAGGWAWLSWTSPRTLPAALRLSPVTLDPAHPQDADRIATLSAAVQGRIPELRSRCGMGTGKLTATLVVEPSGQVRSVDLRELSTGLDARCAGEVLSSEPLARSGWRPVRLGVALDW